MLDRSVCRRPAAEAVEAAASAGIDWLQLREPPGNDAEIFALETELAAAARAGAARAGRRLRILVNRRVDLCLALDADGVHLGSGAVSIADARMLLGPERLVGVSIHRAEAASEAHGADYLQLAPVFAPLSKRGERQPLGLAALRQAARAGIPVLAQGGVTREHWSALREANAAGVAVTGEILMSEDPAAATRALRAALDAA